MMSGGSSDCNVVCISLLVLTTVLASPACITSRSRVYFGCCSSNLSTCISIAALSWMLDSSAVVRNLTTLLPFRLPLQFAAPTRAAPARPTPLSLRKSLRFIALGIYRSLARSPCPMEAFYDRGLSSSVGCHVYHLRSFLQRRVECATSSLWYAILVRIRFALCGRRHRLLTAGNAPNTKLA